MFSKSVPVVMQTVNTECGLACMVMVAKYYGRDFSIATLRNHFGISLRGTSLRSLIALADKMGFSARPLRAELDQLENIRLPCVLHWGFNHFVVLTDVRKGKYRIVDPARGQRWVLEREFSNHFTGVLLELLPAKGFVAPPPDRRLRFSDFWLTEAGVKPALFRIIGLTFALQIFALLSPLFLQVAIDRTIALRSDSLLNILAGGFAVFLLLQTVINYIRSLAVARFGATLATLSFSKLHKKLVALPLSYFEKRQFGDITSRFTSLEVVQRSLSTTFIELLIDGLLASGMFVLMWLYSGTLSTVVLFAVLAYLGFRISHLRSLRGASEELVTAEAKNQSAMLETLRAIQPLILFNKRSDRQSRWLNLQIGRHNAWLSVEHFGVKTRTAHVLISGAENIVVVYLGVSLILGQELTIGMLYAFLLYKAQFSTRVGGFIDQLIDMRMLRLHLDRLSDITHSDAEARGGSTSPGKIASISTTELAYSYSSFEPVALRSPAITIRAGEVVGLSGPSGCGKTTLVKLLLGLLQPTSGSVHVNNTPLCELDIEAFRESVAAVMQDDVLLSGSIAENIAFFDPFPDKDFLEDCARTAGIHEEIKGMPMGYHTMLGEGGTSLSGGQRQRVLLARALYHRPQVLLLDEATSHLDVPMEHRVLTNLRTIRDLTIIIVAHRPETLRAVDRVISLSPDGANKMPKALAS